MIDRRVLLGGLLLSVTFGCTTHRTAPGATGSSATRALGERVSVLAGEISRRRSSLDAVLADIHRASGDTSASVVARSRELRKRALSLDSSYRVSLAEFLWTVNASSSDVTSGEARFPVAPAPAPLLRGFIDGENWMILSPMLHEIGKTSAYVVIVPRGFVTDLASIPQPLQLLRGRNPNTARYAHAAVLHDYLYWRQDCTRAQSDNLMAIAMMEAGIPFLERALVHEAVKQFGQRAWDQNRSARQAGLIRTVAPPHDQVPPTGTWAEYREWLRAARAREGHEYRVQEAVCAMADAVRIPE